jgi:hypothetical protein
MNDIPELWRSEMARSGDLAALFEQFAGSSH